MIVLKLTAPVVSNAGYCETIPAEEEGKARSYLFQVALEQARRCWVPRSSKVACSRLPKSLRLGELMNFNLRRVLMVKCVVCVWQLQKHHPCYNTHTRSWISSTNTSDCPFAVQKWNLKKQNKTKTKEEREPVSTEHTSARKTTKPLIRSTLTS